MTDMTNPKHPANALLSQAIAASMANDSQTALSLFTQASEADPAWGAPLFMIGSEHASLGQMDLAEAAFAHAVLLAPDFAMARYQLGLLQFGSGRAASALVTWQALSQLPGDNPLPHFVRGFAELVQDRFEAAVQCFREGMALNHDNAPLNGDVQQVVDEVERVLEARLTNQHVEHSADSRDAGEHERASHVLLSNYQQQGPAH
jgi:tetratricopeptide (TPR) repeat protein